jgi:hypothetical protein
MSSSLWQHHAEQLNDIASRIHEANQKWWVDINTGEPKERNVGGDANAYGIGTRGGYGRSS